MGIFSKMADKMRKSVRSFLQIQEPPIMTYNLMPTFDWAGNCIKNRVWYRGDSNELEIFYKQVQGAATRHRFWCAVPVAGREIEKIHTGIPAIVVDTLTYIVVSDLNDIDVEPANDTVKNNKYQDLWDEIARDNGFYKLATKAISETLIIGDGAFRVSFDTTLSKYPIIEFIPGDRVELKEERGRLREVIFRTEYREAGAWYTLYEHYGSGYILNELKRGDTVVPMDSVPKLADVPASITWKDDFMMAVPLSFFPSKRFEGRGGSVFDTKTENYDALDETWSQWMDALRKGRTKEYIPEDMLPRNPNTGTVIKPSAFDNAYIATQSALSENAKNEITVSQPGIQHESYLATYITGLDLCLQGIISPSTLGIDTKKLDNAEAQREKEKATLYTRNQIVASLQEVLPELAEVAIKTYLTLTKQPIEDIEATIQFGEYANPSFESQVETVGKARTQGIMSTESAVEELYGDTKDDKWKAEEVERIKAEQGMAEVEEPTVGLGWEDIAYGQSSDSEGSEPSLPDGGDGTQGSDADS